MFVWSCDLLSDSQTALPYNKPTASRMRHLADKCALITGSVRGLGLAAAHRFAAAGCNLVLSGFNGSQDVAALQRALQDQYGVRTIYSEADLRRSADIETMVAAAFDAFGTVDVV